MLIHGGLTTIGEMQGWVKPLAKTWQVIAVEMQGHGRTADTDRPISFTTMGDDIAALLDLWSAKTSSGGLQRNVTLLNPDRPVSPASVFCPLRTAAFRPIWQFAKGFHLEHLPGVP